MGNILKRYNGDNWETVSGAITGDTLPVGAIVAYSSNNAPTNWLICDGSAVNRVTYADLFSVIGTTYGAGDGTTTFNLPNAKGRVITGLDSSQTEFNTIGKTGGSKYLQEHDHKIGTSMTQFANFTIVSGGDGGTPYFNENNKSGIAGTGDSGNLQPYLTGNIIIKAFQSAGVVANVEQATTVSDTNTYSCNYINNLKTYSTEEKVIGIYKGKPLYRKMIITSFIASNENWNKSNSINHNIPNVDLMFVNNDKSYIMRNGTQQLNPTTLIFIQHKSDYENYAVAFSTDGSKTLFKYYYGLYLVQSGDNMQVNITLEYTKTTD